MKFVFSFLGILIVAMIALVITSYLNESEVDESLPEMNVADKQILD